MGFNKRVDSFGELNNVIKIDFLGGINTSIKDSIHDVTEFGFGEIRNFIESNANWRGTLLNSISTKQFNKFNSSILVTAPHAKFVNEGVDPHTVFKTLRDGTLTMAMSGEPFENWLDEHGAKFIVVGASLNSVMRKPGSQFIPKTAVSMSNRLPIILQNHIKRNLR